jgi:penicillin G amidase
MKMAAAGVGAAAVVAGLKVLGRRVVRQPLPLLDGTPIIAGVRQPVEVIRDRWGIPHIYAASHDDLFFAQGYVHAQDRLFQMDVSRRVGAGRLSEIAGSYGLANDRAARIFGWHRAAEAQAQGILADKETAAAAEAYAAGVNAYIAEGHLPLEFRLLRYQPEPWRPFDSAAWGTVLAWGLSVNWETELLRARLVAALGPERAADLTPILPDDYPTILPGVSAGARFAEDLLAAYQELAASFPPGGMPLSRAAGSNNWVVSGEHTTSGRAILANDPHLPPLFPAIWYENHLVGGDYHVTGFTSPGVPGVLIGHNEHIAWGITNAFPDIQDLYVERFHPDDPLLVEVNGDWQRVDERVERIHVRWRRQPHEERVRYTRHGPVISDLVSNSGHDLALRWVYHEKGNHLAATLKICRAIDWAGFRQALHDWSFPSQNVVYADTEGNIGYVMPGRVPIRARGQGLVPVPGWTDNYEWQGWIPSTELPACFNPAEGMIVTANNQVTARDYPYWLTGEWLPPYRARRIADLLSNGKPLDVAAMQRIQQDTLSLPMQRFVSLALPSLDPPAALKPALRAASIRLRAWDGDMSAGSVAASIAFAWLAQFLEAVLDQALGPEHVASLLQRYELANFAASPLHELSYELILRWLAGDSPAWSAR